MNISSQSLYSRALCQWSPERPHSLLTLFAHQSCVYQAAFSPHTPSVIASCSTDGTLRIFDIRSPQSSSLPGQPPVLATPSLTVPAHGNEVLTLDWNKYRPWVLATGGVDRNIKIWDCRMVQANPGGSLEAGKIGGLCENELRGHEYAVRKVQWSPHRAELLASASYDMTCRM